MNASAEAETSAHPSSPQARHVETEAEVKVCYELMRQLRPHLGSAQDFIARWQRQADVGYRLLVIWDGPKPLALAGYRVQDNLMHGVHLYVDDLVTDSAHRGGGHGGVLIQRLKADGHARGCGKLVLDTALANTLAHRFYYRQGLLATSLRFNTPLP